MKRLRREVEEGEEDGEVREVGEVEEVVEVVGSPPKHGLLPPARPCPEQDGVCCDDVCSVPKPASYFRARAPPSAASSGSCRLCRSPSRPLRPSRCMQLKVDIRRMPFLFGTMRPSAVCP